MRQPVGDNGAVGQFSVFVGRAQVHDSLVIGVISNPRRPVNFLRRRLVFAALIGLALGAMATIRPLDAAVVAVVIGVFQLTIVVHDRTRIRELAIQAIFGAAGVAPLFYANWATTGNALRFGYNVLWGAGHQLGFHVDPTGTTHTLHRALEYGVMYVSELNMFAMMWPVPLLLVVVACLLRKGD